MPKHKKKFKCVKEFDKNNNNNDDNDDNISVVSSTATSSIYHNDSQINQLDDNLETKLDNAIEGIQEKSFKEREEALKSLIELFKKHCLYNYLVDKKFTLMDSLVRCLRRGKLSEQLLAVKTIMLTFIQFGYSTPSDEFLQLVHETLIGFIKSEQSEPELRGQCIKTLSLGLYVTIQMDEILILMQILEDIYDNADKILNKSSFYLSALSSWSLLLTIMPINYTNRILIKSLEKFELLLENTSDVEFRICIGEAIALLYELTSNRRDLNSSLRHFDSDNLVVIVNDLIKESSKSTSKKDRRTQHSNFRDILKTIEDFNKSVENEEVSSDGEIVAEIQDGHDSKDFVKVSSQYLYLDNWIRKKQYKVFSDLLGTGMNVHLIENEFLRDIFELGAPILLPCGLDKPNKLSKMQRVSRNKEEFRYRTKDLNKKRETKKYVSDQSNNDDNLT
jgi:hypothetical protein